MDHGSVGQKFLWYIENYSYSWHKNGERLSSPYFTADELENTSWRINVYPRGKKNNDKGYISVYLERNPVDDGPEEVSLNYELSVLAEDGSTQCSEAGNKTFLKDLAWGWPKLFKRLVHIPQDILTVRCRVWKDDGEVRKVPPIVARTRIGIENISFLHVAENFSLLRPNQKTKIEIRRSLSKLRCALSSSLQFADDSCPEGELIVEITPSASNHIICKRKVSLLDSSENIIGCGEDDNRFDDERKYIEKLPLSLTRQDILNKKSEYLPDDKLYLLCECSLSTGLEFEIIEGTQCEIGFEALRQATSKNDTPEKASAFPSGLEDIKTLYVNQCLTDVKLKTKTKSFPSHKAVLSARSGVFKAILTNDKKKKNSDCIQVDDLADDVVEQLLLFLYSDDVEDLQWFMATQLYYAADKYQIGKLKELCTSFLVDNLTTATACELLVLADNHSDDELKKTVEDFILENEEQIFSSQVWAILIEENPSLALKTMHLKYMRKK